MSSRYWERRAKGLCGYCGARPAMPNRTYCEECTFKRKRYTIANADHLYAVQNERRRQRRANGLCVMCGGEAFGKRLCPAHEAWAREYHREYRRRAKP